MGKLVKLYFYNKLGMWGKSDKIVV